MLMAQNEEMQQLTGPNGTALAGTDQLEELIDIAKVEGHVKASSVKKISNIIDTHPNEAVNIIRNWLYSE